MYIYKYETMLALYSLLVLVSEEINCVAFLFLLAIDEDFTINSTNSTINVVFPANSQNMSQRCVDITIVDDDILEDDHSFTVQIGDPSVGTRITVRGSTIVIIQDDEGIHT